MVGEKISLRKRVGLAVLTVLMLLSAVFGAIFMRGIFGEATQTAKAEGVTVGNSDNSSGFNTAESAWVEIAANDTVIFSFTNYSLGEEVYHNWNILFWGPQNNTWNCIRTDDYAWGGYFDSHQPTITNDYQTALENDKKLFDGATVNIVFTRANGVFNFVATMVTTNDATYTKTVSVELADTEYANLRLLVDHSHFENVVIHRYNGNTWSSDSTGHWNACKIEGCSEKLNFAAHTYGGYFYDSNNHWQVCSVCNYYNIGAHVFTEVPCECSFVEGTYLVGRTDFLNGYNQSHSEAVELTDGQQVVITFTNYNSGNGEFFHNWIAGVATSDYPTTKTDADLKVLLRVDNYEIVNDTNNDERLTSNYNWDNFVGKMNGSTVTLTVSYQDGTATVHADIVASTNDKYFIQFIEEINTESVYVFLTNEASYQIISSVVKKYTVTYNTNGGSDVEAEQYVTALPDTLPTPTKDGYTFAGWYTNEGLTETATAGATITANTTLYANWAATQYTITYDLDLGEWGEEVGATTYTIESATFAIPTPVRPGYTFVKWTNAADETVTEIAQGSTGNVTLTANWSEDDTSIFIATWNLVLNDRIGIRYQMNGVANYGYSVKFSIDGRKDVSASVSLEEEKNWYTLYINALEMGDEVTVSVYNNDSIEIKRLSGSTAVAYCKTVEGYTAEQRTTYNISDEALALVESLHDYGYYMGQTGWTDGCEHTKVADPKNNLTDTSSTISAVSGYGTEKNIPNESGISSPKISMSFSDMSTINFTVTVANDYEISSASDDNGNNLTVTCVEEATNTYQVKTIRLKPTELDKVQIVTIKTQKTGDSTVYESSLTASPLSYVKLCLNNNPENAKGYAMVAYYNYFVAANAYANSVTLD